MCQTGINFQKTSEYEYEIPQSHTAPWGKQLAFSSQSRCSAKLVGQRNKETVRATIKMNQKQQNRLRTERSLSHTGRGA